LFGGRGVTLKNVPSITMMWVIWQAIVLLGLRLKPMISLGQNTKTKLQKAIKTQPRQLVI